MNDDDLYIRGVATLVASWEAYARGSAGATLMRQHGVSAAIFTTEPERAFFNNALFDRGLVPTRRAASVDAIEAAYTASGIESYAAWVHESDDGMRQELTERGYTVEESTRAMGMSLDDVSLELPDLELGPPDWAEYLRTLGVPDLLAGAQPGGFHALVAQLGGTSAATAVAYDHDGDCGIFNVFTLEPARRRGIGTGLTGLTARHIRDAIERGCTSASLQSTPMAEGVYAAIGFRNLGRILEYRVRSGAALPPSQTSSSIRS
jgi:hypothetical protein